jgi:hypothetical protein
MKYLPLGTHVAHSHLAASVKIGRNPEEEDMFGRVKWTKDTHGLIDKRDRLTTQGVTLDLRPPTRLNYKTPQPLERWVICWPRMGEGYVTGLTFRSEGWIDTYTEGDGWEGPTWSVPYLHEKARYPLYEIRRTLRMRPVLAPVWAVMPYGEWRTLIDAEHDPLTFAEDLNRDAVTR